MRSSNLKWVETNLTTCHFFAMLRTKYFLSQFTLVHKIRLKILGIVIIAIAAAGVSQSWNAWKTYQQEGDANYTQLQNLLKARRYKEADQETTRMMLVVARREKEGWLDTKAIGSFPCQDLRTIDQLWVQNSNGRFGFSVQRQVYNQVGKDLVKFADQVEWRVYGAWKNYDELIDEEIEKAPQAHLPIESFIWELASPLGIWAGVEWGTLFSRVESCKI